MNKLALIIKEILFLQINKKKKWIEIITKIIIYIKRKKAKNYDLKK